MPTIDVQIIRTQEEVEGENFAKLLEQNWHHSQHVENERAQFMQVYAAIIAGFVGFAFVADRPIPYVLVLPALFFLTVLTFLGFFLTLRWSLVFEEHRMKVTHFEIKMQRDQDPSMVYPSITFPLSRQLRTRFLFQGFFYIIIVGLSAIWFLLIQANVGRQTLWYVLSLLVVFFILAFITVSFIRGCVFISKLDILVKLQRHYDKQKISLETFKKIKAFLFPEKNRKIPFPKRTRRYPNTKRNWITQLFVG